MEKELTVSGGVIHPGQIAGINKHYRKYSFRTFLQAQQRLGIEKIELWCGTPHVFLDGRTAVDAVGLKKEMGAYGVSAIALTCPSMSYQYQYSALPEHREQSLAYFSQGLKLACELECPIMTLNSGWALLDESDSDAWKRAQDMIACLARLAGRLGVSLAMESLRSDETTLVNSLNRLLEMLKEVDSPSLKVTADTGALCWAGKSLEEWFQRLGDKLVHMHFIDGRRGETTHLVWGEGELPLPNILECMGHHNYQGYLVPELGGSRYLNDPERYDRINIAELRNAITGFSTPHGNKGVLLTFDDGPNPEYTPEVGITDYIVK